MNINLIEDIHKVLRVYADTNPYGIELFHMLGKDFTGIIFLGFRVPMRDTELVYPYLYVGMSVHNQESYWGTLSADPSRGGNFRYIDVHSMSYNGFSSAYAACSEIIAYMERLAMGGWRFADDLVDMSAVLSSE